MHSGSIFWRNGILGWAGLMDSGIEVNKLIYCCINIGMIIFGAIINRRVFVIYGALGVTGYLGYLSYNVFRDSVMLPIALSALGLIIIALVTWWQKKDARLFDRLRKIILSNMNYSD